MTPTVVNSYMQQGVLLRYVRLHANDWETDDLLDHREKSVSDLVQARLLGERTTTLKAILDALNAILTKRGIDPTKLKNQE